MEQDTVSSSTTDRKSITPAIVEAIVSTPQNINEGVKSISAPNKAYIYSLVAPNDERDSNARRVTNYRTFRMKRQDNQSTSFGTSDIDLFIYKFCVKAISMYSEPHNGVTIDAPSIFKTSNFRYTIVGSTGSEVVFEVADRRIGYALLGYDPRTVNEDYLFRLKKDGPLSNYFYAYNNGPIPFPATFSNVMSKENLAYRHCVCGGREMMEMFNSELWCGEVSEDDPEQRIAIPEHVKNAAANFKAGCAGCLKYEKGSIDNLFSKEYCNILSGPPIFTEEASGDGGESNIETAVPLMQISRQIKEKGESKTIVNEFKVYFDPVHTRVITDFDYQETGNVLIDLSIKLNDTMSDSTGTFNSMHVIMKEMMAKKKMTDQEVDAEYAVLKKFVDFALLSEGRFRAPPNSDDVRVEWTVDHPYSAFLKRRVSNVVTIVYSDKSLYDAVFAGNTMNKPRLVISNYLDSFKRSNTMSPLMENIIRAKDFFKIGFIRKKRTERDSRYPSRPSEPSGVSYGSGFYGPATGPVSSAPTFSPSQSPIRSLSPQVNRSSSSSSSQQGYNNSFASAYQDRDNASYRGRKRGK